MKRDVTVQGGGGGEGGGKEGGEEGGVEGGEGGGEVGGKGFYVLRVQSNPLKWRQSGLVTTSRIFPKLFRIPTLMKAFFFLL